MKKVYAKPVIEIEAYTLSDSIAANCGSIVNLGPGDHFGVVCEAFEGDFDPVGNSIVIIDSQSFYDGVGGPACDCYYSAGGEGYFTS